MERIQKRRIVARMSLFFLLVFAVTSIGDAWSTELGRRLPGVVELNPQGFQPLLQSIAGELAILAIGLALVASGSALLADTLATARRLHFFAFLAQFQARSPATLLVFAPIAIAEVRILAVANNVSFLAWGWSPISRYGVDVIASWTGLSSLQSFCLMLAIVGVIVYVPVIWTIYRAARPFSEVSD